MFWTVVTIIALVYLGLFAFLALLYIINPVTRPVTEEEFEAHQKCCAEWEAKRSK